MFGGTKTLYSSGWSSADRQQRGHASSLKSTAKRLVMSAFRAIDKVPEEAGILLTFDDGPDPEVTPRVLDLLAEYGAKAVFFVVGDRIPRAPEMLTRIINEGHLVGNHTFRHPLDGVPSFAGYFRDIKECQVAIGECIGVEPQLFRPPLGILTAGSLVAPKLIGLKTMLWSIEVGDWKIRQRDDAEVAGVRLGNIAERGDIVLLHDDNKSVVPLLSAALSTLGDRGIDVLRTFQRSGLAISVNRCR